MVKTNWLRKQLLKLRQKHQNLEGNNSQTKLRPTVMAIDRWFMRYQKTCSADCDPLMPMLAPISKKTQSPQVDSGFIADLVAADVPESTAHTIVSKMTQLSHQAAVEIQTSFQQATQPLEEIVLLHHKHTIDVMLGSKKKLLKLNHQHYRKLRTMFYRSLVHHSKASSTSSSTDLTSQQEVAFHRALFCVLARYHTQGGHGFQAACTEHVFDVLYSRFGVNLECFASPLNCRYSAFCSAFSDTDTCFGSLGSFFQFMPSCGSFQANPPFEASIMEDMARHIDKVFSKAAGPLSFVVIVPGWTECKSWQLLTSSKWKQHCELIARDDHGFCDGASHQRQDR